MTAPTDGTAWLIPETTSLFWHSYHQRSRVWHWPAEADLEGHETVLSLAGHMHDASWEIFLPLEGAVDLTVGRTTVRLRQGLMGLAPPASYHFMERAGDDVASAFCLVAPNDALCPFTFKDLPDSAYEKLPLVLDVADGPDGVIVQEPGLKIELHDLAAGDQFALETSATQEAMLVLVSGRAAVSSEIGLHELRSGSRFGVHPDMPVVVTAAESSRLMVVRPEGLPSFLNNERG